MCCSWSLSKDGPRQRAKGAQAPPGSPKKKKILVCKIFKKRLGPPWFLAWAPLTLTIPILAGQPWSFQEPMKTLYIYIYVCVCVCVCVCKKEKKKKKTQQSVRPQNQTEKPKTKEKKKKRKEKKGRGESKTEKVRDPSRCDVTAHAMTSLPTPTLERPIFLPNTHAAISCRIPKPKTHLAAAASCSICAAQSSFIASLLQPSQFTGI